VYPIFFKGRRRLLLALVSVLVGTTGLIPQFGLAEDWFVYIPTGFLFGGFFYLVWVDEIFRIWKRPQKKRSASTVALRGLRVGTIGAPFLLFGITYAAIFRVTPPYDYLFLSAGSILVAVAFVAMSIALALDWRHMPRELEKMARQTLLVMKQAGLELDDRQLWIGIDPRLSSPGYSYSAGEESVILVSLWSIYATDEGGLKQTLVHEMCHIYLTQNKHPSHNSETFEEAYSRIVQRCPRPWQQTIVRRAIIFPRDAFAEDLMFKVLEGSQAEWAKSALEYFGSKIATKPGRSLIEARRRWRAAILVVNNCYLATQMEKRGIPDTGGIVKTAIEKLLSSLPAETSGSYDYFHEVFLKLKDNISEDGFRNTLEDYLDTFVAFSEQ